MGLLFAADLAGEEAVTDSEENDTTMSNARSEETMSRLRNSMEWQARGSIGRLQSRSKSEVSPSKNSCKQRELKCSTGKCSGGLDFRGLDWSGSGVGLLS